MEQKKKMGFLGPLGTHSEAAAGYLNKFLGEPYEMVPCSNIYEAIHDVEDGVLDSCLVPVENSIEGSINITLDTLAASDHLRVVRELIWRVHNNLMMKDTTLPGVPVRKIISHSQPLSQCRKFIRCNYPLADLEAVASTAMAAQMTAASGDTEGIAAICTLRGGELNGLKLLAANIEDQPNNCTRFYQLIRTVDMGTMDLQTVFGKPEKALIICQIDGKTAGRLCDILLDLARRNVNLTRIESRPARTVLGEYIFFLDVELPEDITGLEEALGDISRKSIWLRRPGIFPVINAGN